MDAQAQPQRQQSAVACLPMMTHEEGPVRVMLQRMASPGWMPASANTTYERMQRMLAMALPQGKLQCPW